MRNVMLNATMLLLICSLTAQAAETREQIYRIGADVDAQGHITATQVDPGVPISIAPVLASAVKQWQFVPAKLNGRSVPAHTFISAKLQALPNASGQYNLRISFAGNGPKFDRAGRQPPYPRDAVHRRQAAFVFINATVQPDGRLADMTVNSQFAEWPVSASFKDAALKIARTWHFIPEQVDGQPVATQVRIPMNFTLRDQILAPEQVKILREAARKESAMANAEVALPTVPLPSEQEVALDSPLQPNAVATIITAP
ncbi:energy transducer TonB [Rhodanobacter glycinis]|uniref:energy transducer TonB n=1 Tax=Rhodanobacter glycinis TaxID=582702 RepID=UPI001F4FFEAE|nr:energy transducer TonB [Rhodanobacter glycinis]